MSWKRFKFGNHKVYVVPGSDHRFRSEHDAKFYCEQNGIDYATVDVYDSSKEYDRWNALLLLQRAGEISGLRRQVEYELLPAKFETVRVKDRSVREWRVINPFKGGITEHTCGTRKDAEAWCKEHSMPYKFIQSSTRMEPVYKEVCIEQNAVYTADFVYRDKDGNMVVEDVKSEITRKEADYVLRRKLMLHVWGIRIKET